VGFYSRVIFPRLCDFVLRAPFITRYRRELLAQVDGNILEIGFGTGLNLPCYPEAVRRLTVVEPNAGMHRLAERRLQESPIELEARTLGGESLPFEADSFDCVVSTFTLCSIDRVESALAEVWRVLKPGGRFLFLEHGLSPSPRVQRWQRRLNWLSFRLGDGCRLDRNMRELIVSQPFASLDLQEFELEWTPPTHSHLYRGCAHK
jgi:ubiquinone/menaquinone biosynthesis C-methylase UbiE